MYIYENNSLKCTDDSALKCNTKEERRRHVYINGDAMSIQQIVEWGVHAVKHFSPSHRSFYLPGGRREKNNENDVLLYNFRTRLVGINQLHNSSMYSISMNKWYISHTITLSVNKIVMLVS